MSSRSKDRGKGPDKDGGKDGGKDGALSRRRFLQAGAVVLAGGGLAARGAGTGTQAVPDPASPKKGGHLVEGDRSGSRGVLLAAGARNPPEHDASNSCLQVSDQRRVLGITAARDEPTYTGFSPGANIESLTSDK